MLIVRFILCLLAVWPICAGAQTHFQIDVAEAKSGWLLVAIEAACPKSPCDFQMPVWNATYQVRDFAQFVHEMRFETAAGTPLPSRKTTPSSWRVDVNPGQRV